MRLVGATNGTIRIPFLLEGVIEGLVGAGAAIVALLLMKVAFIDPIRGTIQFLPLVGTSDVIVTAMWIIPVSIGVAVAAGFFATRRYMDV